MSLGFPVERWDGQQELYYVVRAPRFEPSELNAEYVFELRWWTLSELVAADATFAPDRLPDLLAALLRDGPPAEPIDVGV